MFNKTCVYVSREYKAVYPMFCDEGEPYFERSLKVEVCKGESVSKAYISKEDLEWLLEKPKAG